MAIREPDLVRLRERVTATIRRGTDLLVDLKSLVARLCGYDASLPDRLQQLIEGLADLVAGLTASDGGEAWVRQHVARLEAGEETDAA